MQFSCAKGDSACKAIRESSLSVFKARSNLRDDDISIAEIRVAFGDTYERFRRLKVDSAIFANCFHRNEANIRSAVQATRFDL